MFNTRLNISYIFILNLVIVMYYRYILLSDTISTMSYFIGYGLSQIPIGLLFDTINIYLMMSIASCFGFIIVFIALMNIKSILIKSIVFFIYGCISSTGMLGCVRAFKSYGNVVALGGMLSCCFSLGLGFLDVQLANKIVFISTFLYLINASICGMYVYKNGINSEQPNANDFEEEDYYNASEDFEYEDQKHEDSEEQSSDVKNNNLLKDIKNFIYKNDIKTIFLDYFIPIIIMLIIVHLSATFTFFYSTSIIRNEILEENRYDIKFFLAFAINIGLSMSFIISDIIKQQNTNQWLIYGYVVSIITMLLYKLSIEHHIFNPVIVSLIIITTVIFDNLKSILFFKKMSSYNPKYNTALTSIANLASVTSSVTYSSIMLGSSLKHIDSFNSAYLFTCYTEILGFIMFLLYKLIFER